MATATLSNKISLQLKTYVSQTVVEILNDPDFGLELTDYAKKRLRRSLKNPRKTISLDQIKKKYL